MYLCLSIVVDVGATRSETCLPFHSSFESDNFANPTSSPRLATVRFQPPYLSSCVSLSAVRPYTFSTRFGGRHAARCLLPWGSCLSILRRGTVEDPRAVLICPGLLIMADQCLTPQLQPQLAFDFEQSFELTKTIITAVVGLSAPSSFPIQPTDKNADERNRSSAVSYPKHHVPLS